MSSRTWRYRARCRPCCQRRHENGAKRLRASLARRRSSHRHRGLDRFRPAAPAELIVQLPRLRGALGMGSADAPRRWPAEQPPAFRLWLLLLLPGGPPRTRFATLCHPGRAETQPGASQGPPAQFPKPEVTGSNPVGGARKRIADKGLRRGADFGFAACSFRGASSRSKAGRKRGAWVLARLAGLGVEVAQHDPSETASLSRSCNRVGDPGPAHIASAEVIRVMQGREWEV